MSNGGSHAVGLVVWNCHPLTQNWPKFSSLFSVVWSLTFQWHVLNIDWRILKTECVVIFSIEVFLKYWLSFIRNLFRTYEEEITEWLTPVTSECIFLRKYAEWPWERNDWGWAMGRASGAKHTQSQPWGWGRRIAESSIMDYIYIVRLCLKQMKEERWVCWKYKTMLSEKSCGSEVTWTGQSALQRATVRWGWWEQMLAEFDRGKPGHGF